MKTMRTWPRVSLIILGCAVLLISPAWAADRYISPTGNDNNGCTNATSDACLTFNKCAHVLRALGAGNHTCYAKAGIYRGPSTGAMEIKVGGWSDSQRITFRGAPGEVARFVTGNFAHSTFTLNGEASVPTQFVTFSDMEIHGGMDLDWATNNNGVNGDNGCDGVVVERVKFICPKGRGSFNADFFQTEDSGGSGYVDGLIIRDNLFIVDNTCQNGGTYNYQGFWTYPNSYGYFNPPPDDQTFRHDHPDGIHLYATRGALVEKNDFIYTNTFLPSTEADSEQQRYAFWWKGPNKDGIFRYNYARGGKGVFGHNKSDSPGNAIHHNVMDHAGGLLHGDVGPLANDKTYNNTVYLPSGSSWDFTQDNDKLTGSGNELWNNLLLGDPAVGNYIKNGNGNDSWCARFSVFNYNIYWPAADGTIHWQDARNEFSTLASWKSYMLSNCGAGLKDESQSRRVDPQLEDPANHKFKPKAGSPAMTGGRGGAYPSYVGAYSGPTDTQQIGCSFNPACFSYNSTPDTIRPAAPSNVRVN